MAPELREIREEARLGGRGRRGRCDSLHLAALYTGG